MFCRKIGAEGSLLQELCHFVILADSAYFVKSTPPRAFSVSFKFDLKNLEKRVCIFFGFNLFFCTCILDSFSLGMLHTY